MNLNKLLYRDKPLFGLDIGHGSLKVVQIDKVAGKPPVIAGYGMSNFKPGSIQNGVIMDPETVAKSMHQLFEKNLVGGINSRRVACSLPTARTFSRPMKIPPMDHQAIIEAIRLEAEQYIPIPLKNLYLDYEITHQDAQNMELLMVATSKTIVDSYFQLLELLDLEPVAFEPSINASARLIQLEGSLTNEPAILIDIGSITTDIALFDKSLLVASTVNSGSDTITNLISKNLHVGLEHAEELKNKYGIAYSEKQQRILDAINPVLDTLVREIQKSIRYYSERTEQSGRKISQIITVGGGALMPGFNQHLTKELRLPTHTLQPWQKLSFGHLPTPEPSDLSMYITAAGEAILDPAEILA